MSSHRTVYLVFNICILSLAAPAPASAGIVFTNFGPVLSYDAGASNPVGNAFDGNNYGQGVTFTASVTSPLTALILALSCPFNCPAPDALTVFLTGDAGDQPGAALESFTVPGTFLGPFGINNPPLMLNSLMHPLLNAGTQYWITVAASVNDSTGWNLNSSGDVSDASISTDGGGTWFSPSGLTPGAFEVDAAVPEPASAAMAAGGVLLCILRRVGVRL